MSDVMPRVHPREIAAALQQRLKEIAELPLHRQIREQLVADAHEKAARLFDVIARQRHR